MWRSEAEPRLRSQGILLELLDRVPDRERVLVAHDWGTREFWRLRERVVEDPLGLAAPHWVVDGDFDLAYHLRFVRLPEPGSFDQLLALAQVLHMTPFDRARPLWEAVLVEGLPDGRAAYLLKLHHSLADGQGIVQLIDLAHSDRAEPGRSRTLPVPAPGRLSGRALAARNLLRAPAGAVRGTVGLGGRVAGLAGRLASAPRATAGSGLRYVQSLGRVLGPPPAPASPLLARRGMHRRLGLLDCPMADLRAAGKVAGGSLNDAFLTAMTTGVGRYHERHGAPVDEMTVALPVSTRRESDPLGSNRFAGVRIAAPLTPSDLAGQMRVISERVRAARDEPALDFLATLAPAMSRLPPALVAPMTVQLTSSIDLQASNIRGLDRQAFLAGARVTHTYPLGALPGPAMMTTLMSHEGTCCIGVTANTAAIEDFDLMMECLQGGLDDVLALR